MKTLITKIAFISLLSFGSFNLCAYDNVAQAIGGMFAGDYSGGAAGAARSAANSIGAARNSAINFGGDVGVQVAKTKLINSGTIQKLPNGKLQVMEPKGLNLAKTKTMMKGGDFLGKAKARSALKPVEKVEDYLNDFADNSEQQSKLAKEDTKNTAKDEDAEPVEIAKGPNAEGAKPVGKTPVQTASSEDI